MTTFDPYHKWLGIPRSEQPPHLYRLLGLQPFEADADVIANAADQRMALLKTFATGIYGSLSEDLLNEVARAKVWLLNPEKRNKYDAQLREQLSKAALIPTADSILSTPTKFNSSGAGSTEIVRPAPNLMTSASIATVGNGGFTQHPHADTSLAHQSISSSDAFVPLDNSIPGLSHRVATKTNRSPITFLLMASITGVIGSLAGYFVLCIIDMRYDFLHLLNRNDSQQASGTVNRRNTPPKPQPGRNDTSPEPQIDSVPRGRSGRAMPGPQQPPKRTARYRDTPSPTPKSKPKEEAAPQSTTNPFTKLPPQLHLPRPNTFAAPVPLLVAPIEELDDFSLGLLEPGDENALRLIQLDQNSSTWHWRVESISNVKQIAAFDIKNNDLLFEWSPNADLTSVAALRNSVLKMRANGHEYFASLRSSQTADPLVVDFEMSTNRVVCEVDDVPDISKICVDVVEVQNSPGFSVEGKGFLKLKFNDETILRFNPEKIATKIVFTQFRDRPAIELRTRYVLPSGFEDDMDSRRAKRKLSSLQRLHAAKKEDAVKVDIEALERIAKVAEQLHERTRLQYRFYLFADGHEVPLMESR